MPQRLGRGISFHGRGGQIQGESASAPQFGGGVQMASHAFGDLAGETQPQPCAMDLRRLGGPAAIKRFKDVGQVGRIDSLSAIQHFDAHARPAIRRHGAHARPAFPTPVFQGIQNKVLQAMVQRDGARR